MMPLWLPRQWRVVAVFFLVIVSFCFGRFTGRFRSALSATSFYTIVHTAILTHLEGGHVLVAEERMRLLLFDEMVCIVSEYENSSVLKKMVLCKRPVNPHIQDSPGCVILLQCAHGWSMSA